MPNLDERIAEEVNMYLRYCQLAAKHEPDELVYRKLAHIIFYHIQELRSRRITEVLSPQ